MGNSDTDAATSTIRTTDDTAPAPPGYYDAEPSDPPAYTPSRTQLHTTSGAPLAIATAFLITNNNPALNQHRSLALYPPFAKHAAYYATFEASRVDDRLKSMTITRDNKPNTHVADVFFDSRNDIRAHLDFGIEHHVLHIKPALDHIDYEQEEEQNPGQAPGGKEKSAAERKTEAEVAAAQGRVPGGKKQVARVKQKDNQFHFVVEGLAQGEYYWRSTTEYAHEAKGKGKGGDMVLVNAAGEVLAVFLNSWDGSRTSHDLGELCLTELGQREEVKDVVAVTSMAVLVRIVMGKVGERAGVLFGTVVTLASSLVMCNVM